MKQETTTSSGYKRKIENDVAVLSKKPKLEALKFSNSMEDATKAMCQICKRPVALTALRSHTPRVHKMSISAYKDHHGSPRAHIIEEVYHKCGICDAVRIG